MACGMPVVTSTKSGVAELVTEHDAGLVCGSRDVAALAAHLRTMLDPDVRRRMGDNARTAVAPLTPEAMTLQLVLLYRELLAVSAAHRRAGAPQPAADAAPPPPAGE
jgi:UDP-glucose:(heptosyl)LPS alpha-1,3-glucosyltransferase